MGDNLCRTTPISILLSKKNNHILLNKKEPNINQTDLLHLCLGHINLNTIQRLVKLRILHSLIIADLLIYESYIEGKMTKRPFTTKGYRVKDFFELVHVDVCGFLF